MTGSRLTTLGIGRGDFNRSRRAREKRSLSGGAGRRTDLVEGSTVAVGAGAVVDWVGSAVANGVGTEAGVNSTVVVALEQAAAVKKSRVRKKAIFQGYVVSLPYKLFHHIDGSMGLQCAPRENI